MYWELLLLFSVPCVSCKPISLINQHGIVHGPGLETKEPSQGNLTGLMVIGIAVSFLWSLCFVLTNKFNQQSTVHGPDLEIREPCQGKCYGALYHQMVILEVMF